MIKNNLTSAGRASLLRQQRQYKIEEAKKLEEEQKEIQKKNNTSIWEKIGDTLYDFGANLVGGASKTIEGVVDTGSALAGNVAGWFGADDFKQQMQENIAYDWTGNNITNPANEKTDASLLNDSKFGQYLEGMAQGIGQLLPTVAVSWIPGVAGLSKVMLFGSAMGNSTEQAVSEGADLGTASVYGALSGGVELLSERISGKLFGAGKIDRALGFKENLGRSLFKSAKSGLGRMAQEAVGEGLEEAFAEVVNPLLKKWTYDPDAKGATFSEIWDSAVVGALTSIAFGGTVGQLPRYKNASRVSRIQDQVNEYNDAVDKLYQDSTNGKLNAEERQARQDELAKRKVIIEENISSIMQEFDKGWNITQKSRQSGKQEALKRINASGNLKMGLNSEGKLVNIQDKANPNNSPYNVLASAEKANKVAQTKDFMKDANIEAISSNMSGQEHLIQYKPTSNPLTTEMKTALKTFADFSKAKGQNQRFVVVDKNDSRFKGARGLIVDDTGVIYLREDLSANDVINNLAQVTAVHEFSHGLEKTGAYQELTRFVFNNLAKNAELAKQFGIENFEADYKRIATLYATNENTRDAFNRKSAKEQREYIQSEYMAKFLSEKAFTDGKTIKSLCRTNQSLGQKILNWLKDFVDRLNSVNKVERQMKVFLQKARNLYSTAIQQSGNIETRKNIAYALNEQNLDKNSEVKYSYDDEVVYGKSGKSISDKNVQWTTSDIDSKGNERVRTKVGESQTNDSGRNRQEVGRSKESLQTISKRYGNVRVNEVNYESLSDIQKNIKDVYSKAGINVVFYAGEVYENNKITNTIYSNGFYNDGDNIFVNYLRGNKSLQTAEHEIVHFIFRNSNSIQRTKLRALVYMGLGDGGFENVKNELYFKDSPYLYLPGDRIDEEIVARVFSRKELYDKLSNKDVLKDNVTDVYNQVNLNKRKNIPIPSNFNKRYSLDSFYGEGYAVSDINIKDYNLVDVKEKGEFRDLLRELNNHIKTNKSMLQSKDLRIGLFNCLQNQKNNVYSKLAEINTAYEKTVSAYNKNNSINIPQTFIQALGYNGVIDGKDSVVYDLNNKKKNLLDYSEDRAKERLDRAIRLFGETDNPAKAGWLLADGRFVDYHRDSANIFTGNILDYEDHWQIEKVFDTRRGTDAIDAFMAEGNIRLMPEAGGIELRGKPNKNQIDKLEEFINKVIDKEGITLDLRPAGTTENHKPNPVSYDSTVDVKEIMQDINSYYNIGRIARVIDGDKFSLDEDIDTMLNDWWDNLSLEDLNEMIQDELKGFDTKEEVKLSKEERRELYVKKLYEEGKLNSVVTKLVNKNPQMKEYFKDTQMNMKYNPLSMLRTKGDEYIVMFHGTPNKNFNEFSPSFIGDNGSVMGEGFYFTESLEYANDYKQRDGRVIASLLDIKKPLSRNKVTITKDELKTFIQDVLVKHKKNYLENFNNDIDFTVDYWINHYDNDIDLIQGMHEHSVMLWEDFYSGLRDSIGYDGVIAWNKAEGTQAIVFNSNQIKDIFNRKPTKSADIRFSVEDSEGNKLSDAQQEFFKDSKVRDENGNLLVVYHGTTKGGFTEFDGRNAYFTSDNPLVAKGYNQKHDFSKNTYKGYLNIKNPLIINAEKQQWYKLLKLPINKQLGLTPSQLKAVHNEAFGSHTPVKYTPVDLTYMVTAMRKLNIADYDGIIIKDIYDNMQVSQKELGTDYIFFDSNQFKNIDNKKPTKSADIRYALEEDSDGNKLSEAQVEFFKDSKVRNENGNLKVVYHGTRSNGEFTEFSKDHISKWNAFGDGFYFTDSYDRASFYARTSLYKTYLNITNPFYTNNNEQYEELLYRANIKRTDVESFAKENNLDGSYLFLLRHYIDGSEYIGEKINLNVADVIKDLGYDGIISEGFDNNEYVAFESNQIKNIDNKNPTESPDIRYSLIESDGKELVALHNLSEEKLRNSIALGGLPVPSIAITKAEFGHSNFGDITLVLKPDAINPADLRNKVFGADAYSKRFPKTVNKLKKGTEEALKEKFRASAELIGDDVRNLGTYIETDSIDNIVDKLASKNYVAVQYLKDKGIEFEPVYTEYKPSNELEGKVVDMLIKEFPEEVKNPGLCDYSFVAKYILPRVADVKYDHYANTPLETNNPNERKAYIELAQQYHMNTTYMQVDNYLRSARAWLKNKGKTVVAERATEEKLREAVKGKRKDIENYLRKILTEYDEGMYYRNDRDIFDYYGNRRDFEQIYNKVTLASIVNYMSGTVQNTEGWGYGVGNVRSLLAKQYKTLEDIRADKDKIISADEMDTLKKQSQDLYFELCYEVAPGDPDAGDEIIKEISEKPYNEKSILRVLKQYDSAVEDPEVIEHIIEFLDQLKDYPTEYFEAKPQRAVMFDEVAKFIAPQTTSNDIIDFFKKKGVEIALYEYDDDDSNRRNIIKNLPGDMRFSVDDDFDISDYYIPSDDGFFNAENPKLKGQERDTEAIKYRAKLKQNKVFSREELEKVIDDAINQKQNIRLTGKRRETAIGELFKRMNTQDVYEKRKTAQDIANFIINNVFYDEIYTDVYEQQVAEFEMIDYYKGHFELNNQIKQELEYRTENGARIVNAWKEKGVNKLSDGTTKAKPGVNPHDVAQDLNDNGLIIDMDKSETEIFLDIYDRYTALDEAIKEFKAQQKELAINKLESSTMKSYRDDLIETILRAYDEKGSKTPYAKLKETYQTNIQNIKAELKDVKRYANAYVNYLVSNKRAKELVKGNKHYSAGVLEDPTLKGFLKAIAQTGNIKTIKRTARARIQKLAEVYNTSKKGSLFNDILGQEQEMTEIFGVKDSVYDENIANMIEYIAQGQGELTTDEIILLTKITDGLIHLYTTYDKVFKNGKYVETEKLAKDYGEKMRVGIDVRNKSKFLKGMWRFRAMFDPHTVMRNLDGYRCEYNEELGVIEDRGFFTEMFQEITDGEVKANVAELELLKPFGEFFKSHKGFEKGLTKDNIKLNGTQIKTNGVKVKTEVEMSVGEAISIYLTSLRPQSNFYDSSVILQNKDKTTSEYSFDVKQINELFGKFTEAQKQYIKLVQKFFNEDAQKLKVETDLATLGYTNIEDSGVYFPINREKSAIAKNLGDTQVILDAINTYTLSFNKDVRPGAKLPIRISNVYGIVQNHAKGIGAYYGLSVPLKTFNRVFNKQIESMGKQSLKRIASSQMYDSVKYIDKLLKDIQGRQYDNTIGGKILRWMRANYAKFQLGFNPKTILGQTSSYMMASIYLDADALAKGLVMKTNTEQMFKYAPFTRYRMQEKTIVKAQGVIDKVGTWTDTFTKGIEWMDNNVVKKLWNASQVQIEKNTGHKIGTEENLNRASKLFEKVVRETQSNSIASEMTSLARSENEVLASFTMFSSDSQKQVSRFVDGLGLLSARKQWIANGTIKADDKIAKVAKKQIFRAGAGYVTATTMFVLIGMMMKHLLGKNDEDETITEEFFGDFKTQVAGLIPIYRDVYGFMNDGYELDNYAYGMINDALQGAKSMKNLAEDIISGKQLSKSEIGMPLRRSIYSLAQLFGVPVRNVWNYGYGIVNQFSPSTAYRMNSLFYDAKLTDLDKSIESGNDRKSLAIIKELFESKNLDIDNTYAKEVLELYKDGVNVIPGEIKETFTYNGEEITLTSSQHKQLLDAMNKVLANFNDVVKQSEYKKLTTTQKRTYLNNLYDINYILNVTKIIGLNNMKDSDIKKFLFANILGSDLISYMAYIKTFESDKDKEGNTITNSKKTKIQNWVKRLKLTPAEKYLLMGFAGYKNINGESTVNSYLRRKGLSKDERELVLKWCGY